MPRLPSPNPDPFLPQDHADAHFRGHAPHDQDATHDAPVVRAVLLARFLARYAVRNTSLDDLHAGTFPVSRAGDYSDVTVQTPEGPLPWDQLSRLSDPEMRALMLEVEVQLARALQTVLEWHRMGRLDELLEKIEAELFGPDGVPWDRPGRDGGAPGHGG